MSFDTIAPKKKKPRYGNNGICLAKKAKIAFDMKINAVKKRISDNFIGKEYLENIYTFDNLPDEIINQADFIYATLPETKETVNIFDKNFFKKMNKNAVFINVGRGNAVVEDDIIEALEKRSRVLVVSAEEGLGSTAELMEYAKELGRNRNDLYEIPVWKESINVVDNELFYMQAVHQESDVIPENIDAIRALLEMESDNEKSIAKTNKAMGIF